jgi:hypothetical protein
VVGEETTTVAESEEGEEQEEADPVAAALAGAYIIDFGLSVSSRGDEFKTGSNGEKPLRPLREATDRYKNGSNGFLGTANCTSRRASERGEFSLSFFYYPFSYVFLSVASSFSFLTTTST